MKRLGRLTAMAGTCLLAGAMLTAPAGADQAEVFVGSASGRALALTVAGQTVSLGTSTSKVTSELSAIADAAGQLAVVGNNVAPAHSAVTADGQTASSPKSCAPIALPTQISAVLDTGIACSESNASIVSGNPQASAKGYVDNLGITANSILSNSALPIQTLADTLKPVIGALPQGAQTTLNSLVTSVLKTKTLDLTIGNSTSNITTDTGKVTSTASSAGAVLKLFPAPVVNGAPALDPIATITVGPATATAVYDRTAGKATPSVTDALVSVDLNPTIATALGVQPHQAVPVDQDFAVPGLVGTPLETHIRVSKGTTSTDPDGTVHAVADAVSIQLAQGVQGGVNLQLAHAEAAANGSPQVVTPQQPAETPVAAASLPRTGPSHPWLPMAGAGLLVLALLAWRPIRRML